MGLPATLVAALVFSVTIASVLSKKCSYKFQVPGGCEADDGTTEDLQRQVNELREIAGNSKGGVIYTRWARTSCPAGSLLVYKGYAAGTKFDQGGTSDIMCLTEQPQWSKVVNGFQSASFLQGVEYGLYQYTEGNKVFQDTNNDGAKLQDFDVPCAVCYNPQKSIVTRFPALVNCPDGWQKEYQGYLVSGHASRNTRVDSVCYDQEPEVIPGSEENRDPAILVNLEAKCGSLPCDKYPNGHELTCVVCSR